MKGAGLNPAGGTTPNPDPTIPEDPMTRLDGHEADPSARTSDAQPGDVLIQISHPYSSTEGRKAKLVVTDRMSGIAIITVLLNAEQFLDLMSSTAVPVSGATLPTRPERIGKRMRHTSTAVRRGDERTPEQVQDAYLADGWDSVRIDRTNYGSRVVAYRWTADDTAVGE